jgi:hypothetical protein
MTDTAEVKNPEVKTSNMETHSALPPEETERLGGEIVAALKTVFDPEIPADIYELGLIYKVDIKDDRRRVADDGGECGGQRSRRRRGQCQSGMGPGVDAGPDDRRGAPRPQHVVKRESMIRKSGNRLSKKIMLKRKGFELNLFKRLSPALICLLE